MFVTVFLKVSNSLKRTVLAFIDNDSYKAIVVASQLIFIKPSFCSRGYTRLVNESIILLNNIIIVMKFAKVTSNHN